ncbi:MAG TPA: hypothetical protein VFN62_09910 [Acidobacteriaceae bacterium]|nr:hypothetical protein [Acidobacteriaceae bacterium]
MTVCENGNGRFEAQFPTGVSVRVGPEQSGAFATRMCNANLSWNHDKLVAVANTSQVDIDVLGADLGLGVRVVAFQVRKEEAWPPADAARIKAKILAARAKGIDSQVATIASTKLPPRWHDAPIVYKFLKPHAAGPKAETESCCWDQGFSSTVGSQTPQGASTYAMAADSDPVAILLWRPPLSPSQQSLARSQETLQLVIDEAGNVHSAKLLFPKEDPELMNATKNWKFIPAFKDGQPVAYNTKVGVLPYQ